MIESTKHSFLIVAAVLALAGGSVLFRECVRSRQPKELPEIREVFDRVIGTGTNNIASRLLTIDGTNYQILATLDSRGKRTLDVSLHKGRPLAHYVDDYLDGLIEYCPGHSFSGKRIGEFKVYNEVQERATNPAAYRGEYLGVIEKIRAADF
jgi:hypothetical protein